jgi:hypothetical protein
MDWTGYFCDLVVPCSVLLSVVMVSFSGRICGCVAGRLGPSGVGPIWLLAAVTSNVRVACFAFVLSGPLVTVSVVTCVI